jgi:hypothetical protein
MTTRSGDESLERLRAAIRELVADDAGEVVAEARADARARVRSMLSDAMSHSLLERIEQRVALASPEPAPADEASRPLADGESAWYVYGVVGAGELAPDGELTGVEGSQPVAIVREGSLAAVASHVPFEEFDDARLRAHLADMEWVEELARRHEAVLDWTRRRTTVIPMRMCTVYRTEGGVREMLRRELEVFEQALAHLNGKAEWGVKVFAERDAGAADDPGPDPGGASGAAYMDRRRRDLERREEAASLIQEACGQIHERLCAIAVDGLVAPPQRAEASGHDGEMMLNGAYLVEDDSQAEFDGAVSELQDEFGPLGLALVLTGPWPAYNFIPGTIGAAW